MRIAEKIVVVQLITYCYICRNVLKNVLIATRTLGFPKMTTFHHGWFIVLFNSLQDAKGVSTRCFHILCRPSLIQQCLKSMHTSQETEGADKITWTIGKIWKWKFLIRLKKKRGSDRPRIMHMSVNFLWLYISPPFSQNIFNAFVLSLTKLKNVFWYLPHVSSWAHKDNPHGLKLHEKNLLEND